jgi:hypothetical protein
MSKKLHYIGYFLKSLLIQLVKKLSFSDEMQRFIILILKPTTESSLCHPISPSSILILHSHMWLGLPHGIFPSSFSD